MLHRATGADATEDAKMIVNSRASSPQQALFGESSIHAAVSAQAHRHSDSEGWQQTKFEAVQQPDG